MIDYRANYLFFNSFEGNSFCVGILILIRPRPFIKSFKVINLKFSYDKKLLFLVELSSVVI